MPPDDVQVCSRKTLFTPVARRSDDRLMFADHRLEIFDRLDRDSVLRVAKIHERTGVSAMLGDHYFHRCIGINRLRRVFFAGAQSAEQSQRDRKAEEFQRAYHPAGIFVETDCRASASLAELCLVRHSRGMARTLCRALTIFALCASLGLHWF